MADGTIIAQFPAPGPAPVGLAFDGEGLWISDRKDRKIFRVDPNGGHVLFSIAFDGELSGCGWDGKHVWQADQTSRTISQIDPETGEIVKALKVEHPTGDVAGVSCEGDAIWYSLSRLGQLRKVKQADGSFIRAYPSKPEVCGLVALDKHLFFTEPAAGLVHKMHIPTGSILVSYNVGGKPMGICQDGKHFWIADPDQKRIVKVAF